MKPISSILAATDLSPAAATAVQRAAALARPLRAELELLHIVPSGRLAEWRAMLPGGAADEATVVADARRELEALAAALGHGEAAVRARVQVGVPHQEIAAAASAHDLVVAGAHGAGGLAGALLGTTVDRVVCRTPRPVLVTRLPGDQPYRRVVVAVDFSPESLAALAAARLVAGGAELTLVHALDVEFEGKLHFASVGPEAILEYRQARQAEAAPRLKALAAGSRTVVGWGYPARVILDNARRLGADLVVAGKRGQSRVAEAFLGSVSRHVLNEFEGDVLL